MVSSPSPPEPADPKETAAAQTATNIGSAIANQAGAMVNQITPLGSLTYDQTGTFLYSDPLEPNADPYEIPTYTATVSYTPEGQAIYDQTTGAQLNLATLANEQSGRLNTLLAEPVDLSNEAVETQLFDAYRDRMDPYWDDREASIESRLANQGIMRGSEAFTNAMDQYGQERNDAYTSAGLAARGQAINEILTARNQPINEIIGLMSGSQVQQPTFGSTPTFSMPTTDYAGIQQAYDQQVANNWYASQASNGFPIGGLFSLAGALL